MITKTKASIVENNATMEVAYDVFHVAEAEELTNKENEINILNNFMIVFYSTCLESRKLLVVGEEEENCKRQLEKE